MLLGAVMSLFTLLFRFEGRIDRQTFNVAGLAHLVVTLVLALILDHGVLACIVFAISMWTFGALQIKRLHDLDYRAAWMAVFVLNFIAMIAAQHMFVYAVTTGTYIYPVLTFLIVALAFSFWCMWLFIKIVFYPGNAADNRFGAREPLALSFGIGDRTTTPTATAG